MTDTPESGDPANEPTADTNDDKPDAADQGADGGASDTSSDRHGRGLRPIDIAGIVVAVIVVLGVVVIVAKGHKTNSAAAGTSTAGSGTTVTTQKPGPKATSWVYTDLAGNTVTVVKGPSGSSRFAVYNGYSLPLAVIAVNKAVAKKDCAAIQQIYDTDKAPNSKSSQSSNDRHSAFAAYALAQAKTVNCPWATSTPTSS